MFNLKSLSRNDKCSTLEVMNRVGGRREWETVKKLLPSAPTKPPWVWLAYILSRSECQIALKDALPDIPTWSSDLDELYSNPIIQMLIKETQQGSLAGNILALGQDCKGEELIEELRRLGVRGVDSWAKDLWRTLGRYDDFKDFYIEGNYARKWAVSGLDVQLKPCGKKGPDVRVSDGEHIFVEVTRCREDELLAEKQNEAGRRREGITIPITTQQIYSKILGEYDQLVRGAANAILIHSDSSAKEEADFRSVCPYFREEIWRDTTLHSRVNAFIFYDKWGGDPEGTYCYVLVNKHAACPLSNHFINKIAMALDPGVEFV